MNRHERDVVGWLHCEGRPLSHLLDPRRCWLSNWIRSHGGDARHLDAANSIGHALQAAECNCLFAAIGDNVVRLDFWRAAHPTRARRA